VKPRKNQRRSKAEQVQFRRNYMKKQKTELCKNFMMKGWCKWGDSCSFAHGNHELRKKTHLHDRFKTLPCRAYHVKGFCSYGLRCQYQHDEVIVLDKKHYHNCVENPLHKLCNDPEAANGRTSYSVLMDAFENSDMDFSQLPEMPRLEVFESICQDSD
jgi:hypothetical protein